MVLFDIFKKVVGDLGGSTSLSLTNELKQRSFNRYNPKIATILYNIVATISVLLSMFVLKIPIWEVLLLIVGVDILFTICQVLYVFSLESTYQRTLNDRSKLGQKIAYFYNELKICEEEKTSLCKRCKKSKMSSETFCKKVTQIKQKEKDIKLQISELEVIFKTFDDEIEESVDLIETLSDNRELKAISDYKEVIEEVEVQVNHWVSLDIGYKKIVDDLIDKSKELILGLEKNPSAYTMVQYNFNVYLLEVIQTIKYINGLVDESEKEKYNVKLNSLVVEYTSYVDNLIDKVRRFNIQNIDVSINTLLKDIKEKKEML